MGKVKPKKTTALCLRKLTQSSPELGFSKDPCVSNTTGERYGGDKESAFWEWKPHGRTKKRECLKAAVGTKAS